MSTGPSKHRSNAMSTVRRVLLDRTGQTLLIATAILIGNAWFMRGTLPTDLQNAQYFDYQKLLWRANADVVILGDSRTLVGLQPLVMSEEMRDVRILNFCFGGVGYSAEYLTAAERVWDQGSNKNVAVLGITPRSLRQVALNDNQFVSSSNTLTTYNVWKSRWFGWVDRTWPSLDRGSLSRLVHATSDSTPRQHADGSREPCDQQIDHQEALRHYRQIQSDPIHDETVNRLLGKVTDWTARGIAVYGFRPPTCSAMETLEDDFVEESFVRAFEQAGGHWLSPSPDRLQTYDGSHLDRQSARLFSRRIAASIPTFRPPERNAFREKVDPATPLLQLR